MPFFLITDHVRFEIPPDVCIYVSRFGMTVCCLLFFGYLVYISWPHGDHNSIVSLLFLTAMDPAIPLNPKFGTVSNL